MQKADFELYVEKIVDFRVNDCKADSSAKNCEAVIKIVNKPKDSTTLLTMVGVITPDFV
jgi:3-methyladenine DNA glycosylase AlkC